MLDIRFFLFSLAVCGWLACGAQSDPAEDIDSVRTAWEMADEPYHGQADDGDTAYYIINTESIIAAASKFTPEELNSPVMNESAHATAHGNDRFKLVDWCFEHLFISGLLALLLAYGGTWVVYRICRYLFIKPKTS